MGDPYCLSDKRETPRSKYHHGISSVLLDHDSSRDNTHSHTGFLLVWAYCLLLHHYFFKNTNTARHFTSSTLHNAPDPYCPLPIAHDCAAFQIESLVTTRFWLFFPNIGDLIIGHFYIAIRLQIRRFTIKYLTVRKMRYGHNELSKIHIKA